MPISFDRNVLTESFDPNVLIGFPFETTFWKIGWGLGLAGTENWGWLGPAEGWVAGWVQAGGAGGWGGCGGGGGGWGVWGGVGLAGLRGAGRAGGAGGAMGPVGAVGA